MKRLLHIWLLISCCSLCFAQTRTENEVRLLAADKFSEYSKRTVSVEAVSSVLALEYERQTCLYAVNFNPKGWMLVSAAKIGRVIYAYSANGHFDGENMPDAMAWLLECYSIEIRANMNAGKEVFVRTNAAVRTRSVGSSIYTPGDSLLSGIKWAQSCNSPGSEHCEHPYNYYCPSATNGNCGHCPVGCGAVALGMVMRYWQWPQCANVPTVTNDYGQTYSDYETHSYNWKMMPNQLCPTTATDSAHALQRFLKDVGYAADTKYTSSGSSTNLYDLTDALTSYHYNWVRHSLIVGDWSDTVKAEIDLGRPVIYGGRRSSGGHWFVFDGYRYGSDGVEFHVNWGWNGSYNAFYSLSNLNPGGTGEYNMFLDIITNIYPLCSNYPFATISTGENGEFVIQSSETPVTLSSTLQTNDYYIQSDTTLINSGFSIGAEAELHITSFTDYQYCNSYGPGNANP